MEELRASDAGLDRPSLKHSILRLQAAADRQMELQRQETGLQKGDRGLLRYLYDRDTYGSPQSFLGVDPSGLLALSSYDPKVTAEATSETVHHLRCALDHLVYNLAWLDRGTPNEATQFLVVNSEGGWTQARKNRLAGINSHHLSVLREYQPPPVGNCRWTKRLASLSNTDKHRFLVSPVRQHTWEIGTERLPVVPDPTDPSRLVAFVDPGEPSLVLTDGDSLAEILGEIATEASLLLLRFRDDFGEKEEAELRIFKRHQRDRWWHEDPPDDWPSLST